MYWWGLTLGLIGSVCFVGTTFGQGLILFRNLGWVNAPVYDVDGKTPLGPGFLAQLYAAPIGNASLEPVGTPVVFATLGYFLGPGLVVARVPVGSNALVQVRAWRASDGSSFELANHPGGHVGASAVLEVGPLGAPFGPGLPAYLNGLQSFSLYVVPEPTAVALGLVGSVALGLRRWARRL